MKAKPETRHTSTAHIRGLLPVLTWEDEFPQLQVSEHESIVMAMGDGRSYLIEESGSLGLLQPSAGADEGVHVPMALPEEHVGPGVAQEDLHNLVDVLMCGQAEVGC